MCCFSRAVDLVANTNIFARPSKEGRQYIAYAMTLSAKEDLAMILPIPTPKNAPEDAVKFINLEKYAGFFTDLRSGFPVPPARGNSLKTGDIPVPAKAPLKVVEV